MLTIGVAGGTGSGKSTLARALAARLGEDVTNVIAQDAYYTALSDLSPEERAKFNFDSPAAFENKLLLEHLRQLAEDRNVDMPTYDFPRNTRSPYVEVLRPKPFAIVEGLMVLADVELRAFFDLRVYVEADADVRLIRRLQRDVGERGYSLEFSSWHYATFARPMHELHVRPSMGFADLVISGTNDFKMSVEVIASWAEARRTRGSASPNA